MVKLRTSNYDLSMYLSIYYNFDLTSNSSLIVFFLNCLRDFEVSVTQCAAVTMVGFIYTFSSLFTWTKKNHAKARIISNSKIGLWWYDWMSSQLLFNCTSKNLKNICWNVVETFFANHLKMMTQLHSTAISRWKENGKVVHRTHRYASCWL